MSQEPGSSVGVTCVAPALAGTRRYDYFWGKWRRTRSHSTQNMFFAKASLVFVVVTLAAVFCAQPVDAARGPKITSKVYFEIQHGDQAMGRSASA